MVSEADFNGKLDDGAHEQKPEHEIIKCAQEQLPIGRHLRWGLVVRSEMCCACFKVCGSQPPVNTSVKLLAKAGHP